jgi:pimeloyl-ACP methyl ester carboxylesterase
MVRNVNWVVRASKNVAPRSLTVSAKEGGSSGLMFVKNFRCLRIPPSDSKIANPPLVLLGGTAQTINSWIGHYPALSRHREVFCVELRGQGPPRGQGAFDARLPPVLDVSLSTQTEDLEDILRSTGLSNGPIDLCGFSFGGRVAMSFAATHPHLIRKVAVTSVGTRRGNMGRLLLAQWKACLSRAEVQNESSENETLRAFAWASILSTHHPSFLARNEAKVAQWVDLVVSGNTQAGLLALLNQTHQLGSSQQHHLHDDPLLVDAAEKCKAASVDGSIFYGDEDRILEPSSVVDLANAAGFHCVRFDGGAHAVPLEMPLRWRTELLSFLSK